MVLLPVVVVVGGFIHRLVGLRSKKILKSFTVVFFF